eukprot:14578289-Ditylum_brightwellii.AAC.1
MDLHCASTPIGLFPGIHLGCLPQGDSTQGVIPNGRSSYRGDGQSTSTGVHLTASPTWGGTIISLIYV